MLSCLIVAVIVLWIAESAVSAITPLPPPVWMLVRLLVGLLVLLYALNCLGILSGGPYAGVRLQHSP
jgi:hypothetical protein